MSTANDYEQDYEEFWKDIVENYDGTLNLDQVKRELFDWHVAMHEVSLAYSDLTGGRLSKANSDHGYVIAFAEEEFEKQQDENLKEMVSAVIDVFEDCDDDADPQELRTLVLDALGVSEAAS